MSYDKIKKKQEDHILWDGKTWDKEDLLIHLRVDSPLSLERAIKLKIKWHGHIPKEEI